MRKIEWVVNVSYLNLQPFSHKLALILSLYSLETREGEKVVAQILLWLNGAAGQT